MSKTDNNYPHQQSGQARVVAISSGKGGVGKTSIAVNLGISLAKLGARVCLFDADTGLANVNILLGLTPEYTLEHVLFGARDIEEIMLDGPHGMKVIPGANGISECVSLHPRQQLRLTRELARVESEFDFLLIDTAAGISETTLDFVSAAQHTLIVITGEPTSLTDAFSLIKLLKRRSEHIHYHVVVNMCSSTSQAKEIYHRFNAAVDKYIGVQLHYLGYILRDESLRAAVSLQSPVALFPDTDPSSRSFIRLADSLDSATIASAETHSFSSYWQQQYRDHRDQLSEHEEESKAEQTPSSEQVAQERDEDYVVELRSRLLALVEQGHADAEQVRNLLQEAVSVYLQRHGVLPINIIALLEQSLQSPERDDQLMRDIYDVVKPWGVANVELADQLYKPAAGDGTELAVPEALDDNPQQASTEEAQDTLAVEEASLSHSHHYDAQRFGSQQHLLDVLKQKSDTPHSLLELIDKLR